MFCGDIPCSSRDDRVTVEDDAAFEICPSACPSTINRLYVRACLRTYITYAHACVNVVVLSPRALPVDFAPRLPRAVRCCACNDLGVWRALCVHERHATAMECVFMRTRTRTTPSQPPPAKPQDKKQERNVFFFSSSLPGPWARRGH